MNQSTVDEELREWPVKLSQAQRLESFVVSSSLMDSDDQHRCNGSQDERPTDAEAWSVRSSHGTPIHGSDARKR